MRRKPLVGVSGRILMASADACRHGVGDDREQGGGSGRRGDPRAVRSVSAADMPQPMSTPTADGMIAPGRGDHGADGTPVADVCVGIPRAMPFGEDRQAARRLSLPGRVGVGRPDPNVRRCQPTA